MVRKKQVYIHTEIIVNIRFSCSVLPINISGMTKHNNDINSSRLFCRGVPVNNSLLFACEYKPYICHHITRAPQVVPGTNNH